MTAKRKAPNDVMAKIAGVFNDEGGPMLGGQQMNHIDKAIAKSLATTCKAGIPSALIVRVRQKGLPTWSSGRG